MTGITVESRGQFLGCGGRASKWEIATGILLRRRVVSIGEPCRFTPAETDPIIRYAPDRGLPRERATAFIASNLRPRDTASTLSTGRRWSAMTVEIPCTIRLLARSFPYRARGRDLSNSLSQNSWQIAGSGSANRIAVYEPHVRCVPPSSPNG